MTTRPGNKGSDSDDNFDTDIYTDASSDTFNTTTDPSTDPNTDTSTYTDANASTDGSVDSEGRWIEMTLEEKQATDDLRRWIQSQDKFSCLLDTQYLSRFLRTRDFNQTSAREKLRASMKAKTLKPHWFTDLDTQSPDVQSVLDTGYFIPLPGFNQSGERVLIQRIGALDTSSSQYNADSVIRTASAVTFYDLLNEKVQKQGLHYVIDCSHFTLRHKLYWSFEKLRSMSKCMDGFPARVKRIQCLNSGYLIYMIFALIKPFLPKKIVSRIKMSSLEDVYNEVPMSMLPREYLPEDYTGPCAGSVTEILGKLKKEISSSRVRDRLLLETHQRFGLTTPCPLTPGIVDT